VSARAAGRAAEARPTVDVAQVGRAARTARALMIAPVIAYRKLISPALPRRYKYEPTCSQYAVDAVRRFGILRGLVLAAWRLLRCNPFSYGGYDPVEAQRVFRGARRRAP